MYQAMLIIYAVATGFCAAGLLSSFYQLLTNQPARFLLEVEGAFGIVYSTLLCVLAGPFIIMRNAIRGRRIEQRPLGWLAASSVIAVAWSLCSGIMLLELVLSVRSAVL